jgi:hypothetical protein
MEVSVQWVLLVVAGVVLNAGAFPDGAPVDACVKPRPNQPYHGQARPQPPGTNPYQVLQSDVHYGPGTQITGEALKYSTPQLTLTFFLL